MMSRVIAASLALRLYPVSIGCLTRVLISMTSPRLAFAGTLTRERAISELLRAGGQRHDHIGARGPEGAVAEFGDGDHSVVAAAGRTRRTEASPAPAARTSRRVAPPLCPASPMKASLAAQFFSFTAGVLPRHESDPSRHVPAGAEGLGIGDGGHESTGEQRTDTGNIH